MDANGDTLWTRAVRRESVGYGVSVAHGIVQTRDGGFAVFGTDAGNDHSRRPYLVRLSSAGAVQWQSTIYSDTFEHGSSIQQTADAGFVLAGPRDRAGVWMRKVDSSGTRQWDWMVKEDAREVWPRFTPVTLSGDGGFVTTGHKDSFGLTLWKVNSAGSAVWRRVYVDEHAYDGQGVILTADRGFAVVGLTGEAEPAESSCIYLLKVDSNGYKQWCKFYDGRELAESTTQVHCQRYTSSLRLPSASFCIVTQRELTRSSQWLACIVRTVRSSETTGSRSCARRQYHEQESGTLVKSLLSEPSAERRCGVDHSPDWPGIAGRNMPDLNPTQQYRNARDGRRSKRNGH